MAQRTVCLCDGKLIGIESIYTVVNGHQINKPEKLKELRAKSQNNELFCPCGCGANLILVAGDRNLREQHFRIKDGSNVSECHMITEGKKSLDSKIALKCWLDDKLGIDDVETRVPIKLVGETNRKYEFTFLSRTKKVAVSYSHERVNLLDEKLEVLEANCKDFLLIYIVDDSNRGTNGQYPEALMKIQERQGYCLFLEVEDASYEKAKLSAAVYVQDSLGFWKERLLSEGKLSEYSIWSGKYVAFRHQPLNVRLEEELEKHKNELQFELQRQEEIQKRREELQRKQEEAEKERILRLEERKRKELEEAKQYEERSHEFKKNLEQNLSQQKTPVRDEDGVRWIKCEFCGFIGREKDFKSYGGPNHVNLGTCYKCASEGQSRTVPEITFTDKLKSELKRMREEEESKCPNCGGRLREKMGRFGRFMGCSNYPKCNYTRPIR